MVKKGTSKKPDTQEKIPTRVILTRKLWAMSDAKRDAGLTEPENIEKFRDISYGPYGEENLLDVYRPVKDVGKTLPVIVNVHGGGYFYGDKELYRFYAMRLSQFGFAVVNFNYRLAPLNQFPAPLADTLAVFKWISANARKYKLDKTNLFMVGDSAGAQLVSQFAAICTNKAYAKLFGFMMPRGVILRGISLACGLYELRSKITGPHNEMMLDYFGDESMAQDPRTEVSAYITADYPPTYIFSAANDSLREECRPFASFLRKKGISVQSRIYGKKEDHEVGHVFHVNIRLPIAERCNKDQTTFFKRLVSGE